MAPDIEAWFQQDKYSGNPDTVAQWADAHSSAAQAWVNADSTIGGIATSVSQRLHCYSAHSKGLPFLRLLTIGLHYFPSRTKSVPASRTAAFATARICTRHPKPSSACWRDATSVS